MYIRFIINSETCRNIKFCSKIAKKEKQAKSMFEFAILNRCKKVDYCLNKLLNNIGSNPACLKMIENGFLNSNRFCLLCFFCFYDNTLSCQNMCISNRKIHQKKAINFLSFCLFFHELNKIHMKMKQEDLKNLLSNIKKF